MDLLELMSLATTFGGVNYLVYLQCKRELTR